MTRPGLLLLLRQPLIAVADISSMRWGFNSRRLLGLHRHYPPSLSSQQHWRFSSMTDDLQHRAQRKQQEQQQQRRNGDPNSIETTTDTNRGEEDPSHSQQLSRKHYQQQTKTKKKDQTTKKTKKKKYHLPKRIILLRHGESLGNLDENSYAHIPDWKIPMTRRGERQALRAARELRELLHGESLFGYCSPYKRTMETWTIIEDHLTNKDNCNTNKSGGNAPPAAGVEVIGMRVEPRIAEQQFGNFQNPKKVRTAKSERRTFGRFFFRFPNGEAGLDVYNRVSSFLATLSRDIRQIDQLYSIRHDGIDDALQQDELQAVTRYPLDDDPSLDNDDGDKDVVGGTKTFDQEDDDDDGDDDDATTSTHVDAMKNMNILIVTHGLTLRLLLMRYFQLSVEEFENSYNSQNARLVIMDRFVDNSREQREYYRLHDAAKEALNLKGDVSNEKPVYWRDTGDNDDHGTVPPLSSSVASVSSVSGSGGWDSVGTGHRGGLWSLPEDDDMEE